MTRRRKPHQLRIAGVMTGTSCDALDASVLEFTDAQSGHAPSWRVLGSASRRFEPRLRREILELQRPGTRLTLIDLLSLERRLGKWFGQTLTRLFARGVLPGADLIALHGQTIAHHPARPPRVPEGLTLQIGSPEAVALATGLTVISHFRDGDILAGGQGAPLVPAYHREWVRRRLPSGSIRRGVALHNIGGMSNLTYIGPSGRLLAFDTGPGNAWIDEAVRIHSRGKLHFDRDGRIAALHAYSDETVRKLLGHSYFRRSPPKSTGRDEFPFDMLRKEFDRRSGGSTGELVSTATEVTSASIIRSYEKVVLHAGHPLSQVIVCGGGALNLELMERLRRGMSQYGVRVVAIQEIPGQLEESSAAFLEAQAFAFFGHQALRGLPIGGPWTGTRGFAPPGRITPGENFQKILRALTDAR